MKATISQIRKVQDTLCELENINEALHALDNPTEEGFQEGTYVEVRINANGNEVRLDTEDTVDELAEVLPSHTRMLLTSARDRLLMHLESMGLEIENEPPRKKVVKKKTKKKAKRKAIKKKAYRQRHVEDGL